MAAGTFLRDLVTTLAPNATVVGIDEQPGGDLYRVRVAGTTGVIPDCELARGEVVAPVSDARA